MDTTTPTPISNPLRQMLLEFQELTEDEEALYFDCFCFYCSKKIESQEEYNAHWCAAKQAVKTYFKYDDFKK